MTRLLLLTLINMAAPFIIRAIYLYVMRRVAFSKQQKGVIDVTPPEWHFPKFQLILIGCLLTMLTLAIWRFSTTEVDTNGFDNNQTRNEIIGTLGVDQAMGGERV